MKYQRPNIPKNLGNTAVRRRQCPFIIVVMITPECFVWHHNGACRSAHGKCCKYFILKNHWTVIDPKWVSFPSHHDIPGESRTYHALYGTLNPMAQKSCIWQSPNHTTFTGYTCKHVYVKFIIVFDCWYLENTVPLSKRRDSLYSKI